MKWPIATLASVASSVRSRRAACATVASRCPIFVHVNTQQYAFESKQNQSNRVCHLALPKSIAILLGDSHRASWGRNDFIRSEPTQKEKTHCFTEFLSAAHIRLQSICVVRSPGKMVLVSSMLPPSDASITTGRFFQFNPEP